MVSIPFIAGQWSLPQREAEARKAAERVSIPFIAGQWSLRGGPGPAGSAAISSFNPLHCGAVVASAALRRQAPRSRSFNPLHCGAVVASRRAAGPGAPPGGVSIPFIAGQWSLHILQSSCLMVVSSCFNPLHCGAVVASGKGRV